ncbi:MAG: SMP-30/gluconolactonase/LRE family protein, partial [bacterium]|nr:SMP-30/gluconolactonase/LRE family protein [bacterium]
GECPIWDMRSSALYWVDIESNTVHRWDSTTSELSSHELGGRPGSIALTSEAGLLLVAIEHSLALLDWSTGACTTSVDLPIDDPEIRLNDGRVDRAGSFWVGSMHVPSRDRRAIGSLYRVRGDWTVTEEVMGVRVSNGLAFSPDAAIMYFADTSDLVVRRYALDAVGRRGAAEPFADFAALGLPGKPDGGCVDSQGGYWIACVRGSAVARITADGSVDRLVSVPFRRPTCVAFGGPDLATLFVTSIGGGGDYEIYDDEPDAGRVLAIDVGFTGVREGEFATPR